MKKWCLTLVVMGFTLTAGAVSFQSPTGNILCVGDTKYTQGVECYIQEINRTTIKRPSGCLLDWGHTFFVGRKGGGQVSCHGDVPESASMSDYQTLAYGKTITGKGWACSSAKTGMTCTNQSGRGFLVSKSGQRVF